MSTNNTDYHRDLEDIRDRLNWVVELVEIDEFTEIKERLHTLEEQIHNIEEDQNRFIGAINNHAEVCKKLVDAYNTIPPLLKSLVEQLTQPRTPSFSETFTQAFSKATAPSTKTKHAKTRKPKLTVVSKDKSDCADDSAHGDEPPKGAA
jgi:hypothetical protein